MTIVYPVDQRLQSGRAHDILIVRTCHVLAEMGHTVFLVMQEAARERSNGALDFLEHYGIGPHPRLHLIQIRVRRKIARLAVSWRWLYRWLCFLKVLQLLRKEPVDLLYLSELKLSRFLLRFRVLLKKPIVYEVHNLKAFDRAPFRADPVEKKVLSDANGVIVTTKALIGCVASLYGKPRLSAAVSLASDLFAERFSFHPVAEGKKARIFYVGQHYPLQGIELLIEAMRDLPECELHTVGGRPEEIAFLKKEAARFKVDLSAFFHGFIRPSELPALLKEADLFVVPSRNQGRMPFVAHTKIYEYMAYGKPIVASDLPSIREVLIDAHNAVLVAPDDPRALARGIQRVVSDPALAEKIARNARECSLHYTWEARGASLATHFGRWFEEESA